MAVVPGWKWSKSPLALAMCVALTASAQNESKAQLEQARKGIRHVVVIFQENISFDHYFGTYPHALNPEGEPAFTPLPNTPAVDGYTQELLTQNPNFLNPENGTGRTNPFRLKRSQAATADQDHSYGPEQKAFHGGKMDLFPKSVGYPDGPRVPGEKTGPVSTSGLTMGYFDGNTVTAYWNYAQHFAMSDNHFDVIFGPSTPGAINLVSGQTNGVVNDQNAEGGMLPDGNGGFTLIADPQPSGDVCSSTSDALVHMTGRNIGDMMNQKNVTWGFFQGGFDLTVVNANGSTGCRRSSRSPWAQMLKRDYLPHHEPFQYYKSTANPRHIRPTSAAVVGTDHDGGANHQYDVHDFFDAVAAGNFPTVSILKAPAYQDGHSGYSSPLDEQQFVVQIVNFLQKQKDWKNTLVIVAYDDSDGWYDHRMAKTTNGSQTSTDALDGAGMCGDGSTALPGVNPETKHAQGRCGPGPRLPILLISPWAKANYVDHTYTDQTSIMRLIEDLYLGKERLGGGSFDAQSGSLFGMLNLNKKQPSNTKLLLLDPDTGLPGK